MSWNGALFPSGDRRRIVRIVLFAVILRFPWFE